ncbi:hypothetical protein [Nocardioides sp. GY 10127]|uniref:hypothetical protein n=1 Tax=Nocardioides sp. GY 10127 TaxID=2569762 RepID=UPI0014590C17|nr:hypothetical protein [Nocardioides sp. GY 10127]
MRTRVLGAAVGAVLVSAAVGGVVGARLAGSEDDAGPVAAGVPSPVAASGPAYPRERTVRVVDDPDDPALAPDLPSHRVQVGSTEFPVSLRVPQGWVRSDSTFGGVQFYPYAYPDSANTYFLRLRLVANQQQTVAAALEDRVANLEAASDVLDLQVEQRTDDSLLTTYVVDEHRRVEMDTYVARPGEDVAFVWVGVVGREVDREGLASLLDVAADSLRF